MANKKKTSKSKPEVEATPVVKVDPVTDNTPVAPIVSAELVEASGKTDETVTPVETTVEKTEETIKVQVGKHDIEIPAESPELTEEEKEAAVDLEWVLDKLTPYFDSYPNEKEFHITSDGQVFLKSNKSDAKYHQKFLNDGKEVLIFIVE